MIASSSVNVTIAIYQICRRNGISVVNAIDCVLSNNVIHDINGTAPQYGIDVEIEQDCSADNLQIFENTIYGCVTGAICANNGSNYDIYSNTCIGQQHSGRQELRCEHHRKHLQETLASGFIHMRRTSP